MRTSSSKSRGQIPFPISSDNTASSSSNGNQLNVSNSSTFYEMPELTPVTSALTTNRNDVSSLTDDEVRERFKSVMVSSFFSSSSLDIKYFNI